MKPTPEQVIAKLPKLTAEMEELQKTECYPNMYELERHYRFIKLAELQLRIEALENAGEQRVQSDRTN